MAILAGVAGENWYGVREVDAADRRVPCFKADGYGTGSVNPGLVLVPVAFRSATDSVDIPAGDNVVDGHRAIGVPTVEGGGAHTGSGSFENDSVREVETPCFGGAGIFAKAGVTAVARTVCDSIEVAWHDRSPTPWPAGSLGVGLGSFAAPGRRLGLPAPLTSERI